MDRLRRLVLAMRRRPVLILAVLPVATVLIGLMGPFRVDAVYKHSGIAYGMRPPLLSGEPSIEPNIGVTSQALGTLAASDVLQGHLPLWNHYEGFGAPLLGEMQAAALFPPTWLMALPHGQILEQALLQFMAGLGAFLFFRRFGLSSGAALSGALLFEMNGIFAWLRNAIYNPVAFLPWLFLVLEILIHDARVGKSLRHRAGTIAAGAALAALALYSGFPEVLYLYGLMLAAWTAFRAFTLNSSGIGRLAMSLLLTGGLALALAAPLLVAFADFLRQAGLGGHTDNGYAGVYLDPGAMVQYLSPYAFGRIFASDIPAVNGTWGGIGGYIGIVPVVLGLASLAIRDRRGVTLFLWGWVIVAVGTSQGVPGIYRAFTLIPLTTSAASFRYLNASWIFAIVFLSALFLDAVPRLGRVELRRILCAATAGGLSIMLGSLACAWGLVSTVASTSAHDVRTLVYGLGISVAFALLTAGAAWAGAAKRCASLAMAVMLVEGLAWFVYPSMSLPRGGKLDMALVAWLREHAGFGRVLNTAEHGIGVNYGSYFRIGLINYSDLPIPKITGDYIHEKLDPYTDNISFMSSSSDPEVQDDQRRLFRARLSAYADAGVRFVLAGPDFDFFSPYDLEDGGETQRLAPGEQLSTKLVADPRGDIPVSAVALDVSPTAATGRLLVTVCDAGECVSGATSLAAERSGRRVVDFERPVTLKAGESYTVEVSRDGGEGDVLLAMSRPIAAAGSPGASADGPGGPRDLLPRLTLRDDRVSLAYVGHAGSVYSLRGTRAYASAPGCSLDMISRDEIRSTCGAPSRLVRLETAMRGWSSTVDGTPAPIDRVEDVFQAIAVPAGISDVRFSYEPAFFRPALIAAVLGLVVLALIGGRAAWRWRSATRE